MMAERDHGLSGFQHEAEAMNTGLFPLVFTDTTSYWLKHEVEAHCQRRLEEMKRLGEKLGHTLVNEGFPTRHDICILCHDFCYQRYQHGAITYACHGGVCLQETQKAIQFYQATARRALQTLKQIGASHAKKTRNRKVRN